MMKKKKKKSTSNGGHKNQHIKPAHVLMVLILLLQFVRAAIVYTQMHKEMLMYIVHVGDYVPHNKRINRSRQRNVDAQ